MLNALFDLYQASRIAGTDPPQCRYPENRIFGEDWLLRVVLEEWQTFPPRRSRFPFLPFPRQTRVYSEAQLPTPFARRPGGGFPGEGRTHTDGMVGDFELVGQTGAWLCPDWQYLAVFEAKMSSPLSKGSRNAPGYDQVSRTAACMIYAMLEAGPVERDAHLVVLYPRDSKAIAPRQYSLQKIEQRIAERLAGYRSPGRADPIPRFRAEWRAVLPRIRVHFVTWEEALDEIAADVDSPSEALREFYRLCRQFNP
jgi:hypothetical protein